MYGRYDKKVPPYPLLKRKAYRDKNKNIKGENRHLIQQNEVFHPRKKSITIGETFATETIVNLANLAKYI